jgi:threonyl-tRNA synthetase
MENKQIEIARHSLSHVMAVAVKELWPEVKLAIGPVIDNGFYYDFDFGSEKIKEEDLGKIKEKMIAIIKKDLPFTSFELPIAEAIVLEKKNGEIYKEELISDLEKAGEKTVSFYTLGDFTDLCRGPHIESSGKIKHGTFILNKLAGAYWRGDEKNKMLTRIYGLAFATKQELDDYLKMLVEAEKRDHRKIGREQDLFVIDPTAGMGLVMWQPKGALIWRIMEDFWYQEHLNNGYELVRTPHIGSRNLWETSGHWGFYSENMYPPLEVGQNLKASQQGEKNKNKEEYLLKPMNFPFHVLIYNSKPRS